MKKLFYLCLLAIIGCVYVACGEEDLTPTKEDVAKLEPKITETDNAIALEFNTKNYGFEITMNYTFTFDEDGRCTSAILTHTFPNKANAATANMIIQQAYPNNQTSNKGKDVIVDVTPQFGGKTKAELKAWVEETKAKVMAELHLTEGGDSIFLPGGDSIFLPGGDSIPSAGGDSTVIPSGRDSIPGGKLDSIPGAGSDSLIGRRDSL